MTDLKEFRYKIMLALYFPILLYAFSTFDLSGDTYAVQELQPVVVGEPMVVLGQPFTARAFLAVGDGQGQELMGEGALQVLGDSLFRMPTAALLAEGEDSTRVPYAGKFHFQQLGGAVTSIPVEGSFEVRRPEIVASSEATQTLYRQCLNTVRIGVPGLENRPLRLEHGGQRTEGRTVNLSPSGQHATIQVFLADEAAGDVLLGRKRFTVIDPPRPEVRVFNAGREVRNGDNLPRKRALLTFELAADESFRQRFPLDARYRVAKATVYLRKGLAASQEIGTFSLEGGTKLVLTRQLRDAQPGDRIMIRLDGVARINHAGQAVPVPLSASSRTFGFTLS